MLMSYAMHAGLHGHGMDALSEHYLGHVPIPIKSLLGSGKGMVTFDRVPVDDAVKYAAEDADVTLRLWKTFRPQLHRAQVTTVYETLERPLVPVLAAMEMAGIQVDRDTLSRMSNAFAQKMAGLEAEIHALAGESFNVGSPKQLGEILFDKFSLPGGVKGKTGAYATGADVLEDLAAEGHDLPDLYRCAAGPYQPGNRARPYVLLAYRGGHGPPCLDRSEPAEHPRAQRRRAAHPRGFRGPKGQGSGQP
jgi:DNA polymerase-1